MENPNKLEKLKTLGLESYPLLPDKYIDILYESLKNNPVKKIECKEITENKTTSHKKKESTVKQFKKHKRVDNSDPRYQILLKLVNCILVNLNKPSVTKLTEFVDTDRLDIIKPVNIGCFEKMESEIFKHFDKMKAGWYRRKKVEHYILTFLRYACNDIGYDFTFIKKNHQKKGDVKTHLLYFIK